MSSPNEIAEKAKAWPFEEARKLVKRLGGKTPDKGHVLFETGYGPSGLPHLGTFGEVARTTMVRQAFEAISDVKTKLIAFSDDMDGLRKVPTNVPNQEMMTEFLGKPLTAIPDPFGTHESFAHHNNARLNSFLDEFGFDYEFLSSTECYKSGRFDETLLLMLRHYDDVMKIIVPTLGKERQATYSPFLPISPTSGNVLQVPVLERNEDAGTIVFEDENGEKCEVPVTGGHCKLQWKADWAMRWVALDVDYEMAGKDLISSVELSSRICKALKRRPPEGFNFELFLDENGEKISKSKGNTSVSVENWLRYATPESLALYMFQNPRRAKRLYFDVIPKNVDEYITHLDKYQEQEADARLENPVWHIHGGKVPQEGIPIGFSLLLNLVSASNAKDPELLWEFIRRYRPGVDPSTHPTLDLLVGCAINYFQDFVEPNKKFRPPTDHERAALADLAERLGELAPGTDAQDIQTEVYSVGKEHNFDPLRDWFKALYEVLLGQSQGPRFGSFVAIYGIDETLALIETALDGKLLATG